MTSVREHRGRRGSELGNRRQLVWALAFLLANLGATASYAVDLSGSWTGHWISSTTGHRGPLRCTLTLLEDGRYRADFAGRFFKILPFRYSVVLDVVQDGDTVLLSGEHILGRRLGTFTYQAEANCQEFVADYSSCKDCGQFVLSRCCATP